MQLLLSILVIAGAFLAAIFWLWSALIKIPDLSETTLAGEGSITYIMQRQSRLSAFGAASAAVSALAQAILSFGF